MKNILEKLSKFFQAGSPYSNMRLNATMIVFTGCVSELSLIIIVMVNYRQHPLTGTDLALVIGSIASFIGIGIWGKSVQSKNELNATNKE